MKKWTLFLGCYFALCMIMAACTAERPETGPVTPPEETTGTAQTEETDGEEAPVVQDLSALYLEVLNDLWATDSALNEDITVAGVDLSGTSLTEGEQAAVALLFGETHDVEIVQGTMEDLAAQGYITKEPISSTGSGVDLAGPKAYFTHWEDGCWFSIAESEKSDSIVRFDAQKWRSSLGAYFFTDCTARKGADGWTEYEIGAQAIS